jgi:hypothetical protein
MAHRRRTLKRERAAADCHARQRSLAAWNLDAAGRGCSDRTSKRPIGIEARVLQRTGAALELPSKAIYPDVS